MSELLPPLSPLSQYINTPILTFYIMGVCELEHPFDKSQTLRFVDDVFIPLNKRFSSIIITDEKGVQRWKKVECLAEDHVKVPTFPSSNEENHLYDEELEEYISDINMKELPQDRPPWEVHLIMYPTKNAGGSLVFKLNHALGDGYSFMGALFSVFKAADNPIHPLKFPSASSRLNAESIVLSKYARVSGILTKCKNTVTDFTQGLLRTYMGDADTVIKSSTEGVEYNPITISSVIISLDHIRDVKSKVGGTVNDVTTGLIAYSLHLYMKKLGESSDGSTTALIVMNMRMLKGYKTLAEMLKASIWGNHFGFLTISLPSFNDFESVDPLDFIVKAKEEMKRKSNSLGIYFTSKLLHVLGMVRGPETAARYLHSNLRNASIMITNMCGPVQKAAIEGNPLNGLYFTVPGVPQSLVFTIVSYMGKLRLVATAEKGFIDSKLMSSCIKEAFTKMYVAACGESPIME